MTTIAVTRRNASTISEQTRGWLASLLVVDVMEPQLAQSPFDDLDARITKRAYELYLGRDCRDGGALEDWLNAERELFGSGSV